MAEGNSRPAAADSALADALVMAAIRLTRTLRALNRHSSLSGPQISLLSVVVYAGQIAARDLARHEEVTPATISRLIASLENEQLIVRRRDATDTRVQWITATARGRQLVRDGHRRRLAPLVDAIHRLPPSQRETLRAATEVVGELAQELAQGKRAARASR
jgi:DNA-binding MarR family transcriptional regulator